MFDSTQSGDELSRAVFEQLRLGADPDVIAEHLVRDLDMPRELAEQLLIAGRYAVQDDPGMSDEQARAVGGLLSHEAVRRTREAAEEAELEALDAMSVRMPAGDGRCSDIGCPCPAPGTEIPRGEGYLYIGPACVAFRREARSRRRLEAKGAEAQRQGRSFGDHALYKPVLTCELGARTRGLDLEVAAADARRAWAEGRAPMRATPRVEPDSQPATRDAAPSTAPPVSPSLAPAAPAAPPPSSAFASAPSPAPQADVAPAMDPQRMEEGRRHSVRWYQVLLLLTGFFAGVLVLLHAGAFSRGEIADEPQALAPMALCCLGALWALLSVFYLRPPRSLLRAGCVVVVAFALGAAWARWGGSAEAPWFWTMDWGEMLDPAEVTHALVLVLWQAVWPFAFTVAPVGYLFSRHER